MQVGFALTTSKPGLASRGGSAQRLERAEDIMRANALFLAIGVCFVLVTGVPRLENRPPFTQDKARVPIFTAKMGKACNKSFFLEVRWCISRWSWE